MPYKYTAYTSSGQVVEGTVDAETEAAAYEALRRSDMSIAQIRRGAGGVSEIRFKSRGNSGITVVSLHKIKAARPESKTRPVDVAAPSRSSVGKMELAGICRRLAQLLGSGINLLPAVQLLRDESPRGLLGRSLGRMAYDIQQGSTLSEAAGRHKAAFPVIVIRLIEAGERAGNLEEVLGRLAGHLEREAALGSKLRAALAVPAAMIGLLFVTSVLLVNFVLPGQSSLSRSLNADLPATTSALLGIANLVGDNIVQIVLAILIILGGVLWYRQTPQGRRQTDRFALFGMPGVRTLVARRNASLLAGTLALSLGAGLPATAALDLSLKAIRNTVLLDALAVVRDDVGAGLPLSEAMARHTIFPTLFVQMVRAGEEKGALPANMQSLARLLDEQADRAANRAISVIKPILMIVIWAWAVFLALAVIAPLYSALHLAP